MEGSEAHEFGCMEMIKESKSRFYIARRCLAMLICWHKYGNNFILTTLNPPVNVSKLLLEYKYVRILDENYDLHGMAMTQNVDYDSNTIKPFQFTATLVSCPDFQR